MTLFLLYFYYFTLIHHQWIFQTFLSVLRNYYSSNHSKASINHISQTNGFDGLKGCCNWWVPSSRTHNLPSIRANLIIDWQFKQCRPGRVNRKNIMIMACNKLNASRQRRMLDEIEDGHHVTAELSFRCITVFWSFLCLAHGGKQGCKLNFTPLTMSSCLLGRRLINGKWLQFSFGFLTFPDFFSFCDYTVFLWGLNGKQLEVITAVNLWSTFNFANIPWTPLSKTVPLSHYLSFVGLFC